MAVGDSLNWQKLVDRNEVIQLASELISIESHPGNLVCEEGVAAYIHAYFIAHGIRSRLKRIEEHRYNVYAEIEGEDTASSILFTGHMDTVEDYGHPGLFTPKITDGYLYGRGACDMKGPIASMIGAATAITRSNRKPPITVRFAFVADEEFKSIGTEALIEDGPRSEAAVLGEPSRMHLCVGNRGLEWMDIWIHGKAAHGSAAEQGVNAILGAAKLIERIETRLLPDFRNRKDPILGHPVLNFGVIRGGNQPSTVAESCLIKLDRRWIWGESVESIYAEIQDLIDELHAENPSFSAELKRDMVNMNILEHGPCRIDPNHPVVRSAEDAILRYTGTKPPTEPFPGWTDASLLSNFGFTPTLIFGPGDIGCAHSERERVSLDELIQAAAVYADIAMNYVGVSE